MLIWKILMFFCFYITLLCDLYTVNCTHLTVFSLSFDRSMYLWNHHHYQDVTHFHHLRSFLGIFPVAQTVKILPAMQETQVWFLDQEDPLEKGMADHSSILAWRIPWTKEPGGPQSVGLHRVKDTTEWLTLLHYKSFLVPFVVHPLSWLPALRNHWSAFSHCGLVFIL